MCVSVPDYIVKNIYHLCQTNTQKNVVQLEETYDHPEFTLLQPQNIEKRVNSIVVGLYFSIFWECCIVCLVEVFAWHDPRTRTYQALLQDLGSGRASVACPIDMVNYMTGRLMKFLHLTNQNKQCYNHTWPIYKMGLDILCGRIWPLLPHVLSLPFV